ncbi:recombinase family protein [Clostridium botulinum]|uniref:recombinase family protein n=1 Tax=Clostridium botulinum TaxID=1491 RepID=UPI00224522D0|nr:recombinase family protein [Clostridium botulinum]
MSATSTKKRKGFKKMIDDALSGKIDLIITKSVSRFARNTVDTLTTVRKLKDKGVEVYFEKENIYTMDSKGEVLITIMSSLAQEESRSISENVTWGQRKRFADGKVSLPYKQFLGYEKGEDGLPKIVESEAKTVRLIYKMFLEGTAATTIARYLSDNKIPSPAGKKVWSESTIRSIMHNEKYKGDAILQKSFTVDFLTKKKKINEGEVPQYYVENSHPAIISAEVFDLAQAEFEKRRKDRGLRRSSSCFSGKIICGECGSFYGNKTWHSNSKYRKVVWRCNHKYDNNEKCKTPHIYEDKLKDLFIKAFNEMIENKDEILRDYKEIIEVLGDTSKLEKEKLQSENEAEVLVELLKKHIERNAHAALNQEKYEDKYNELANKYQEVKNKVEELEKKIFSQKIKFENIKEFIGRLEECDSLITEFDEKLWNATIDKVTVDLKEGVKFYFKN